MSLTLRIDVDKPYGNHTFWRKVCSKAVEETGFKPPSLGYLDHLETFLDLVNGLDVRCIFYFRVCTLPPRNLIERIVSQGHQLGWHLENSRNQNTFLEEYQLIAKHFSPAKLHSFTKHGSGVRKLGRHHYPLYEPEKYLAWGREIDLPFLYGNDPYDGQDCTPKKVFWIEKEYRDSQWSDKNIIVERSKYSNIAVLTHPESIARDQNCENELMTLIKLAKENNVDWTIP